MATLESKIPEGPLAEKWDRHKAQLKLVNPAPPLPSGSWGIT